METYCEFSNRCGFFKKFGTKNSVAWRSLVESYCQGGLVQRCERYKLYCREAPFLRDEMMPNGGNVPAFFELLR